jgi:ATP-dependent Clp protease ATP-binding subunit ClpB
MNINNLTIKAQEVLQSAFSDASRRGQQAVEPLHLLGVLLAEEDSVGTFLLNKVGANVNSLRRTMETEISRLPKVEGGEPYASKELTQVLEKAVTQTTAFGDKYVSAEHLLLAILAVNSTASRLLKDSGVSQHGLSAAITELRKTTGSVDSQTAEQTSDALGRYAINLNDQVR